MTPFKTGSWGLQAQERSKRRLEYFRQYRKRRYETNKEEVISKARAYQRMNPEICKARYRAYWKIKISEGQKCEICKTELAKQRHHSDYKKPFDVVLLCVSCHRKESNINKCEVIE